MKTTLKTNWKTSNINWGPGIFIIIYHLLLVVLLPYYLFNYSPSTGTILSSFALFILNGLSITAGYHRYFSHSTYKAHPIVEWALVFFGTMAIQGSILRWSFDHRHHHAFVDTNDDPYSINKGFWYAHFLWLFEKPKPIESKVVADLMRKPLLRFQDKHYALLATIANVLPILVVGFCTGDYLGAFVFVWLVRLTLGHHFTWFINSLAHTWGQRTFCQELTAADNYIMSFLTFGEGYHNYHHTFAYDYRNGIRWFHFDPTKWLIWSLSKLGLASNLRRNPRYLVEEKILLNRKQILLEKVQTSFGEYKDSWERSVNNLSESVLAKLAQVRKLNDQYRALKKSREQKDYMKEVKRQLKSVKKSFKKEYRHWMAISRHMLALNIESAHPTCS